MCWAKRRDDCELVILSRQLCYFLTSILGHTVTDSPLFGVRERLPSLIGSPTVMRVADFGFNEQFGFRPYHSCPQQALRLVEHISEGLKNKPKTVAVFFNVAKAFDKVWHVGLIYQLRQLQVPDHLVFIIHQYLTNRHFSFRNENSTSAKRLIRAGVPQGSTLSPLLYSAYTNDILRPQTGVQLALFADDTALHLSGSNFRQITPRLQKAIDELMRLI
ncbi:Probable RNA-directed DNA polymerase from transposon BS [Eumeta japonica]|uniref:Probable RNA-directed DNA polymerase from transposon BS n=1 Tax=Eumeta variegata TaxID=151549 RepID=A0A4C2A0A6_EUMVA|nr:Probable RNA-directed DNA polymerase from transposon BS [Eumeta japonica]